MKTITKTELKSILAEHKIWIQSNGVQGQRADLKNADLKNADLSGADLSGADLTGADLRNAKLEGAELESARLHGANLTGADLYDASLKDANLGGADLRGAYLRGANLYGADLRYAVLTGANLTGANLTGTILEKKKEQGTTMILSEEETAVILKMRADKVNQAKIDARDIVIEVIRLVTIELSNNRPRNTLSMRTDDCDEVIGSENLETISQILDLMGVKFLALTANRRAINFEYKKLNSL